MTTYPGGKNGAGVYQRIICQLPPHRLYIEPFLGGGAIMRLKRPAISSIGIDADADVVNAFPGDAISGLTLICGDAFTWLTECGAAFGSDVLMYLDPPYVLSTRRQHHPIYRYELCDDDHARLLDLVLGLRCMVAISGYWCQMYADRLSDWRSISFPARTRGGGMATEWLWMNYPEPMLLHDYRYLGCNYRERERVKRKIVRWVNRLAHMPLLERMALMSALSEGGNSPVVFGDSDGVSVGLRDHHAVSDGDTMPDGAIAVPDDAPVSR
jgi:hypothetical protein